MRPSFMKIVVALQRPDFQILFWSPKDVTSYSKATRTLGGPLADGECLYKNLQHIYMSKTVKQELHMEARSDIS